MSKNQTKTTSFFRIEIFPRRVKNGYVSDILLPFQRRLINLLKLQFNPSPGIFHFNKKHLLSQGKRVDNELIGLSPTLPFVTPFLGTVIFYPLQNPIKNIICSPE
ncbi:hypothetical protein [Mucilaginibacter aquaedulcis]|uniref:hypothetical protein n=1 Tax=Mucilaginibacter aquaedulcis TaxID=1187081 RepID=UPI0025B564E0|nr:hypothetical protein [Mucilaginibacter aquaedulcis]MDN3551019.1 hypothetical protein [Mucilaginibacter aquaedulcis]